MNRQGRCIYTAPTLTVAIYNSVPSCPEDREERSRSLVEAR